jgi:gamma-glutamyltranspeptidase/glutathione hydrolase
VPPSCFPRAALAGLALALGLAAVTVAASPPVGAARGMVVSAHRLASEAGIEVLRNGGNAVDAAVAVGYALAVVYPVAGNLGGGGFMTLRLADGSSAFVDFRETAPAAATEDMYLDARGAPLPQASTFGHRAAGVPGSVAGLEHARERYGSRNARTLIAPALSLAAEGFVLEAGDVALIDAAAAELGRDPAAAAIFLQDGKGPPAGTRLLQADLGRTLEAIATEGAAGFYQGPVATEIARASQAGGGLLTVEDLAAYRVRERAPVTCDYRGFTLISAPPPSSGGVTLCLLLNLVEDFPLATLERESAAYIHLLAEAMRLAFVERNTRLGDPDFVANPLAQLLSDAYAGRLRGRIDPSRVTPSPALLAPNGNPESPQTTHYSVVDGAGNAVSVTTTLNGAFGAKVVAGSTGVLLNNEMDDFTVKPGVPNLFGLVQGRANAIAPGKRPLSSMTPTVVTRDGALVLVIGSPGGPRIISTVMQVILNLIDHGMTIDAAIAAARLHHQWLPDALYVEPGRVSAATVAELQARGHEVREGQPWGQAAGILVGGASLGAPAADGLRYFGAADPRGGLGAAVGY